ncbi:MAG: TIGR02594 family protein [Hyphomicrobiaceae bacterium]|nr:TIGR02594 family protein [Hyphomicrobiaceae bacterium]
MPRVPDYEPSVSLRPAFRQDVDVRATPEAFGADIGRGMQGLARGVENAGAAIAQVRQLEDSLRAKEADNAYADWARERMYGDGGFMTLEGRNAVDARAAFEREAETKRREFGKGLTPGAARAYHDASKARLHSTLQQSIIHTANARKQWFSDASNARIETFANDALAHHTNPAHVNKYIAAGLAELQQQGEMRGWDADTLKQREAAYMSGVHKNVSLRLAQSDALAAESYINSVGDGLTEADRYSLNEALKKPILAAKAERNISQIIGDVPEQRYKKTDLQPPHRAPGQQPAGSAPFQAITSQLLGAHEGRDGAALASFIRRAAGINIDPAVTPWCAAFANAVLGAQGIEGTGSLAARSFLNFGVPTDRPKPGDIVVLSRGNDPAKGHVGFFQGLDANGNVHVLGGNQGNAVSVATFAADRVLGFRSAGNVDENVARLPSYGPQGLADIYRRVMSIADPQEREATRQALDSYYTAQKKLIDAQRDAATSWAQTQIMQNPALDVMKMPIAVQTAIGASGMTTLMSYQEKVRAHGQPQTDERVLYDLQTLFAMDPEEFGELDLFRFRDKLSNSDWKTVTGWRQTALTDKRKASEEGLNLNQAFSQATEQLQAVGLLRTPSKMSDADRKRVGRFQNVLYSQMQEFQQREGRAPTQADVQSMINKLLLPIVMKTPGSAFNRPANATGFVQEEITSLSGWFGLGNPFEGIWSSEGFMFEAGNRPDGSTLKMTVRDYEDIPIDLRRIIATDLERELGRIPYRSEVIDRYMGFLLNSTPAQDAPELTPEQDAQRRIPTGR